MTITSIPQLSEGPGELGQTKTDAEPYTDPNTEVSADIWNALVGRVIEAFQEIGLSDGSTVGSIRKALIDGLAAKAAAALTLTAGAGMTGGGDLSANRTFAVDIAGTNPSPVGTAAPGSSGKVSDRDHVHAHGAQTDPAHHALATKDAHGFLSSEVFDLLVGASIRKVLYFRDDFTMTTLPSWQTSVSGTGAAVSNVSAAGSLARGKVNLSTGTTSTGEATLRTTNYLYQSQLAGLYMEVLVELAALATVGEDYNLFLCGAALGLTGNGFSLGYVRSVSPNWQLVSWASTTPTYTDTGIPVAATTPYRVRFQWVVGSDPEFFLNGVSLGTVTPGGIVSATYLVVGRMTATAGTTAKTATFDFAFCHGTLLADRGA